MRMFFTFSAVSCSCSS
uniref:Uncharacterized protein n=1 Tax=Arundo donax TaxID=35708 RepID=A0A0A9FBY4_ARUDO